MARPLLSLLFVLCLSALAVPAWAEEVFVLENGTIVRGRIIRRDDDQVVIRLTGFAAENRITVHTSEIVRQYTSVDPKRSGADELPDDDTVVPASMGAVPHGSPRTVILAPDLLGGPGQPLTEEDALARERRLSNEGFFARLGRVVRVSMPRSLEARALLGLLLLVIMTVLVAGGARVLGMRATTLHASTSLGLLLGVFFVSNVIWSDALLRADRAMWVLPLQTLIWLGVARSVLDAPLSRTIPLFALVLFASTCCAFAIGAFLVAA